MRFMLDASGPSAVIVNRSVVVDKAWIRAHMERCLRRALAFQTPSPSHPAISILSIIGFSYEADTELVIEKKPIGVPKSLMLATAPSAVMKVPFATVSQRMRSGAFLWKICKPLSKLRRINR